MPVHFLFLPRKTLLFYWVAIIVLGVVLGWLSFLQYESEKAGRSRIKTAQLVEIQLKEINREHLRYLGRWANQYPPSNGNLYEMGFHIDSLAKEISLQLQEIASGIMIQYNTLPQNGELVLYDSNFPDVWQDLQANVGHFSDCFANYFPQDSLVTLQMNEILHQPIAQLQLGLRKGYFNNTDNLQLCLLISHLKWAVAFLNNSSLINLEKKIIDDTYLEADSYFPMLRMNKSPVAGVPIDIHIQLLPYASQDTIYGNCEVDGQKIEIKNGIATVGRKFKNAGHFRQSLSIWFTDPSGCFWRYCTRDDEIFIRSR